MGGVSGEPYNQVYPVTVFRNLAPVEAQCPVPYLSLGADYLQLLPGQAAPQETPSGQIDTSGDTEADAYGYAIE